jgi:hypothetical protein
LVNLENLATVPGSGSGLKDLDPLADRILRPKDPDPDSVGFVFVPSTTPLQASSASSSSSRGTRKHRSYLVVVGAKKLKWGSSDMQRSRFRMMGRVSNSG